MRIDEKSIIRCATLGGIANFGDIDGGQTGGMGGSEEPGPVKAIGFGDGISLDVIPTL